MASWTGSCLPAPLAKGRQPSGPLGTSSLALLFPPTVCLYLLLLFISFYLHKTIDSAPLGRNSPGWKYSGTYYANWFANGFNDGGWATYDLFYYSLPPLLLFFHHILLSTQALIVSYRGTAPFGGSPYNPFGPLTALNFPNPSTYYFRRSFSIPSGGYVLLSPPCTSWSSLLKHDM